MEKWEQNMTAKSVRTEQPYFSFGSLEQRRINGFRVRAWSRRKGVTSWSDPLFYQVGTGVVSKEVANRAGLFIGRSVSTSAEGIGSGRAGESSWSGDLTWHTVLVCLFIVLFLAIGLFFVHRKIIQPSRKQMSDLDPIDNYTKGEWFFVSIPARIICVSFRSTSFDHFPFVLFPPLNCVLSESIVDYSQHPYTKGMFASNCELSLPFSSRLS